MSVQDAWREVIDEKGDVNWILCANVGRQIECVGKGSGGLAELVEKLDAEAVLFAVLKVNGMDWRGGVVSKRAKMVVLTWVGTKAPIAKRGGALAGKMQLQNVFQGAALSMDVKERSEVTMVTIGSKLLAAGGAHKPKEYDFGPDQKLGLDALGGGGFLRAEIAGTKEAGAKPEVPADRPADKVVERPAPKPVAEAAPKPVVAAPAAPKSAAVAAPAAPKSAAAAPASPPSGATGTIKTTCGSCGRAYNLAANLAGKRFACKTCKTPVAVPGVGGSASPGPSSPSGPSPISPPANGVAEVAKFVDEVYKEAGIPTAAGEVKEAAKPVETPAEKPVETPKPKEEKAPEPKKAPVKAAPVEAGDDDVNGAWAALNKQDDLNWIQVGFVGNNKRLSVLAKGGGGFEEMVKVLRSDEICFIGLKVLGVDTRGGATSKRNKLVTITWVGAQSPIKLRSGALAGKMQVQQIFQGSVVSMDVKDINEVTPKAIGTRLLDGGGAHKPKHYDFGAGLILPLSDIGGDGFLRAEFAGTKERPKGAEVDV